MLPGTASHCHDSGKPKNVGMNMTRISTLKANKLPQVLYIWNTDRFGKSIANRVYGHEVSRIDESPSNR